MCGAACSAAEGNWIEILMIEQATRAVAREKVAACAMDAVQSTMSTGRFAGWLATGCLFKNCGAATKSRVVSTTNSNSIRSINLKTAH